MRLQRQYDLVVIGGGAAGLVALREAHRRGASAVMVQAGPPGGDCTFTGCVPSKTLLAAAAAGAGFDAAMARVASTIERIAATETADVLAADGLTVVDGYARLTSPRDIDVDGTRVRAERIIIATGARPVIPPIDGLAAVAPLTNESLFELRHRPDRLLIIGGGAIGCEMAQAFAQLGSAVTIVEAAPCSLAREEPEASAAVERALAVHGVMVRTNVQVRRVSGERPQLVAELDDGSAVTCDEILVAVGRRPSTAGFGLAEVGVQLDKRGGIVTNAALATSVPGIFAAGDVTGRVQLTHAAGRMGWVAASNALSKLARVRPFSFDEGRIPAVTYTQPEVARIGLTEAEAAQQHRRAMVAHLPLDRVDRAITAGHTDGFVRLIAERRTGLPHMALGRLLGATVVAPTAGEMIHEVALAMQANLFVGRLAQTMHAYPTWSSAMQQAALQFLGTSAGLSARPARVD